MQGERGGWRLVAATAVAALCTMTSCAGTDEGAPASTLAPATTVFTREAATARLLALDDLRKIYVLGFDTREQPVLDPKQFALDSLRGPCGGVIDTRFLSEGALRVFRSTVALVIEVLAHPGEAAGRDLLDRLRRDARERCAAFEEQLGASGASRVTFAGTVAIGSVGDDRIGWHQTVVAPDGREGHRYEVVARHGGRVLVLVVLATAVVPDDRIEELARLAADGAFAG